MAINREALIRFGELKVEINKLTAELDMLKPTVLASVQEALPEPGENYVSLPELEHIGKFSWYPKTTYTYSKGIQEAETVLEEMKAEEKATGKATAVEQPVLKFTLVK